MPIKEKIRSRRHDTTKDVKQNIIQKMKKDSPKNCEKIDNKHMIMVHKLQHQVQQQCTKQRKIKSNITMQQKQKNKAKTTFKK